MRSLCACIVLFSPVLSWAAPSEHLWAADFQVRAAAVSPVANAAFYPDVQAQDAPAFAGVLDIAQTPLTIQPELGQPIQQGRDARLFPAIRLEFFSVDGRLVPAQRGEMLTDISSGSAKSYWRVIAQVGRIWRVPKDGGWARASFPLMLVSGIENQAHQGLASFLYRKGEVTALRLQFVQQSAPYILSRFVAAGVAPMHARDGDASTFTQREADWRAELAARLPAQPWQTLLQAAPPGALDDFGGPLYPKWRIAVALVRDGTLYYQDSHTDYGPYPYPLEMRFGVRSVMKSVGVPLSLLHLAQIYGPWVLSLKIGDYVKGLDPKWNRVRFIDAANMATGYGGTGTLKTQPNDIYDGYLEGDYDAWYLAPSQAAKIERINANLTPYPWEPGTVVRYRDQDFFLLGLALDDFLKSRRGPQADIWDMLKKEVLGPIGIAQAPALRTDEEGGRSGYVLFNAGYYPTLDDLAKIALLYQRLGEHGGLQILNRELTAGLLAARGALRKDGDASIGLGSLSGAGAEFYGMGFHYVPYDGARPGRWLLPTMVGAGENEVTLYPNGLVSLIMADALKLPNGENARSDAGPQTIRAVERLQSFGP